MAFRVLSVKQRLGWTDEETFERIPENPQLFSFALLAIQEKHSLIHREWFIPAKCSFLEE